MKNLIIVCHAEPVQGGHPGCGGVNDITHQGELRLRELAAAIKMKAGGGKIELLCAMEPSISASAYVIGNWMMIDPVASSALGIRTSPNYRVGEALACIQKLAKAEDGPETVIVVTNGENSHMIPLLYGRSILGLSREELMASGFAPSHPGWAKAWFIDVETRRCVHSDDVMAEQSA